jgi:predicted nuclease of predicted toxin-antitoxin system
MKFFADENLERPIIEGLRQQGHDIATVPTEEKGSPDPAVLALSNTEDRVFVTNDKDFAELVFLQRQVAAGVILVRLPRFRTGEKVERVLEVIADQGERVLGVFTVIEAHAIRRRPFLTVHGAKGKPN